MIKIWLIPLITYPITVVEGAGGIPSSGGNSGNFQNFKALYQLRMCVMTSWDLNVMFRWKNIKLCPPLSPYPRCPWLALLYSKHTRRKYLAMMLLYFHVRSFLMRIDYNMLIKSSTYLFSLETYKVMPSIFISMLSSN